MKKACNHGKLLPIFKARVLVAYKCQLCQKKIGLKEARPIFDKVFNKLNKGV